MKFKTARIKTAASIAGLALLAVPLAACGSSSDSSSDGGSTAASGPVEPAAMVKDLSVDTSNESTAVTLDAGFLKALPKLGLTPTTFGTATLDGAVLSFPITGGWVDYFTPGSVDPYVVGQVQHEGSGLTLTGGGIAVTIGNFNVDPGRSLVYGDVAANKKTVATSVPIFSLDGSTLMPLQTSGTDAILEGTKVYLSSVAADLLNKTYGTDALSNKVLVGVAKITISTKAAK